MFHVKHIFFLFYRKHKIMFHVKHYQQDLVASNCETIQQVNKNRETIEK